VVASSLSLRAFEATTHAAAERPPSAGTARSLGAANTATQSPSEGSLDASIVANTLQGQSASMKRCYDRELQRDPELHGQLEVQFYIGPSGLIERISTRGFEGAPAFTQCVVQLVVALRFPAPTGGGVEFSFPFRFWTLR
jgi:outer membrane biosynthesis protein TonB